MIFLERYVPDQSQSFTYDDDCAPPPPPIVNKGRARELNFIGSRFSPIQYWGPITPLPVLFA